MKQITDEELRAIRERAERAAEGNPLVNVDALIRREEVINEDIPKLLAEIERLKSVISEVITDNIYHETDEEFDEIYRRYLYGGDSE